MGAIRSGDLKLHMLSPEVVSQLGGSGGGPPALGSGSVTSGHLGDGVVFLANLAPEVVSQLGGGSGGSSPPELVSGAVNSGHLASGLLAHLTSGLWGSGSIGFQLLASGLLSGLGRSGSIGSGALGIPHLASGTVELIRSGLGASAPVTTVAAVTVTAVCAELISGVKAVAWGVSGGVVRADRASGLRLPAFGVTLSGNASGAPAEVVVLGFVPVTALGMTASGFIGRLLFVGSGGLIVNASGFHAGPSSGAPFLSGNAQQAIGVSVSGGLFVQPQPPTRSGFNHALPWLV